MKKKHGLVSTLLITTMLLGTLSGCDAEKVTAEELVNGAFKETAKSMDADVNFNFDVDVDASSLSGTDSDAGTMMSIKLNMDCNVKSSETIAYTEGTAQVEFFGMKQKETIKTYSDLSENVSYSYDEDSDSWTKSDLSSDSSFDFAEIAKKITPDIFEDLTLEETKDKKADYTVSGVVTYKNLADIIGADLDNMLGSSDSINLDDLKYDVKMIFDRKTKVVKEYSFVIDTSALSTDEYVFNSFDFDIKVNSVNDVEVSIPDDVKNNAVEEDTSFGGFEDDLDSDFGVDSSEATTESETSESQSSDATLSSVYFDKDYIYTDDLKSTLSNYYTNIDKADEKVLTDLTTFFNNYTADEFANYLDLYDYWSEDEKVALAIMYDLGVVDNDTLQQFDISSVDVQEFVTNYVDTYR